MTLAQILVTAVGAGLIGGIVWFFWLKQAQGTRAALTSGGYQEAMILVKGGYTPDRVILRRGTPARLTFRREETAACSEMVTLDDFGKSARLPEGESVAIELMPDEPGEYGFACQMGMLRGTLVVE